MKIPNKQQFQEISFNYALDIDNEDFTYLPKNCNAKPYFSLIIDTTLASDNLLRFRKNLLGRI